MRWGPGKSGQVSPAATDRRPSHIQRHWIMSQRTQLHGIITSPMRRSIHPWYKPPRRRRVRSGQSTGMTGLVLNSWWSRRRTGKENRPTTNAAAAAAMTAKWRRTGVTQRPHRQSSCVNRSLLAADTDHTRVHRRRSVTVSGSEPSQNFGRGHQWFGPSLKFDRKNPNFQQNFSTNRDYGYLFEQSSHPSRISREAAGKRRKGSGGKRQGEKSERLTTPGTDSGLVDLNRADFNHWLKSRLKSNDFLSKNHAI